MKGLEFTGRMAPMQTARTDTQDAGNVSGLFSELDVAHVTHPWARPSETRENHSRMRASSESSFAFALECGINAALLTAIFELDGP